MKTEPDSEYAAGAQAFRAGEPFDHAQSLQWRMGFGDAISIEPRSPGDVETTDAESMTCAQ